MLTYSGAEWERVLSEAGKWSRYNTLTRNPGESATDYLERTRRQRDQRYVNIHSDEYAALLGGGYVD